MLMWTITSLEMMKRTTPTRVYTHVTISGMKITGWFTSKEDPE